MISRRKFIYGVGASSFYLLAGCSKDVPIEPIVNAIPDLLSLFWSNPTVKLLSFLKIINTSLSEHQITYNDNSKIAEFETTNRRVTGLVDLSSNDENKYCNFTTPDGTIAFAPAYFIKANDLSLEDENKLSTLDRKIMEDFTSCTDEALDSGEGNLIRLITLRIECFERKGYEQVHLDYAKVKLVNYEI